VQGRWRIKEERRLGAVQERIEAMEGDDGVFRQLEEESGMVDGLAGDIEDALAKFEELAGQLEVGYKVQGSGVTVRGLGIEGLGSARGRLQGSGVWGHGSGVQGSGFMVEG
jgi:hypothetical protein